MVNIKMAAMSGAPRNPSKFEGIADGKHIFLAKSCKDRKATNRSKRLLLKIQRRSSLERAYDSPNFAVLQVLLCFEKQLKYSSYDARL